MQSMSQNMMTLMMMMKFLITIYTMNNNHILNSMIMIEFMGITTVLISCTVMTKMSMELYIIMFVLILLVTESIVGMSIMINMIRTHSNDFMKTTSTLC